MRLATITLALASVVASVVASDGPGRAAASEPAASDRTRWRVLATSVVPVLVLVMLCFRRFLDWIEARPGVVLHDPLLSRFAPRDVALLLFPVMYLAILGLLLAFLRYPRALVTGLWGYTILVLARMAVMSLLPLDPPATMIPLRDPFVELFGEHRTLTRDLFFSGHTAMLALFTFAAPTPRLRVVAGIATVIIATGVLWQHAHYSVDVAAAPFFSYGCYRLACKLMGPTAA